jgi:ELWxxDGT repeat protein
MSRSQGRTGRSACFGLLSAFLLLSFAGVAAGAPGDVTVSQVANIRPGSASSIPQELIDAGGTLLFNANDGVNGTELWKSNGGPLGPSGTEMVENIESGSGDSTPQELTRIGSTVFFDAFDSTHGRELWKIDPPYADAVLIEDIRPMSSSSGPSDLTAAGNTLFFSADDGINGTELWKSAPPYNAASTDIVKNIVSGSGSSNPNGLFNDAGTLFFDAQNAPDDELWKSEPPNYDTASTSKVDVNPSGDSFPGPFTQVNGTLIFAADDGSGDGFELFKLPSPYTTPVQVKDINPTGDSQIADLLNVNGAVFFSATDGGAAVGLELWKSISPFAAASTTPIDINPGVNDSDADQLRNIGGTVFLSAGDGVHGVEPWKSNGGPGGGGTDLVADITSPGGSFPSGFADVNGTAFFRAFETAGPNLFRSTGIGATKVSTQFTTGSAPQQLTNVGGTLFFTATDSAPTTGQELWKATIEPTPAPPASTPTTPAPQPPVTKKKCKKKKHKRAVAAKKCKKKKK